MRLFASLAGLLIGAVWTCDGIAATFEYGGTVDMATPVFVPLTPPGTIVGMVYSAADAAVAGGLVGPADLQSIDMSFGNICFSTALFGNHSCPVSPGVVLPITGITAAALTYAEGRPTGGVLAISSLPPTVSPFSIDVDFSSGTFVLEALGLGTASGTLAVVPVPAAAWLFASAIAGLCGMAVTCRGANGRRCVI